VLKSIGYVIMGAVACAGVPAQAQFFMKSPDFSGPPMVGNEPGGLIPLPGATPAETQAALVWNLRAALNIAALQCGFDRTLLTENQYNYLLTHHSVELAASFKTVEGYFRRTDKKGWQKKFDQYGTRSYISFSTVAGQYGFCQTASRVGRQALFTPKGQLYTLASARMRELRNSLLPAGEQQFPRFELSNFVARVPSLAPQCWDKNDRLVAKCRYF